MKMLKLRELTMHHHKTAERSDFAKKLVSGKVNALEYSAYLYNMGFVYGALENTAKSMGCLDGIESICRTDNIWEDYRRLNYTTPPILFFTKEYMNYLLHIRADREQVLAHVYVRHMGDLSGGQIISKRIGDKFPVNFYQFDEDQDMLKEKLKEKLNNDMADEAMVAFDYAHKIFLELDMLSNDLEQTSRNSEEY